MCHLSVSEKDDVKDVSCKSGYVCYQSDWDISSSLSQSNNIQAEPCESDNTTLCIKPGYNDICTDLTTTFTSFNFTKSISAGMYNRVLVYFKLHVV